MAVSMPVVKLRIDPFWLLALQIACVFRSARMALWLARHPLVKVVR